MNLSEFLSNEIGYFKLLKKCNNHIEMQRLADDAFFNLIEYVGCW